MTAFENFLDPSTVANVCAINCEAVSKSATSKTTRATRATAISLLAIATALALIVPQELRPKAYGNVSKLACRNERRY